MSRTKKRSNAIVFSFKAALDGIFHSVLNERNVQMHFISAIVVFCAAWYVDLSRNEVVILILTVAAVISAELFNTAIETVVDLVSPEYHLLAKIAKNIAAGAVLIFACAAATIGGIIFYPHIFK